MIKKPLPSKDSIIGRITKITCDNSQCHYNRTIAWSKYICVECRDIIKLMRKTTKKFEEEIQDNMNDCKTIQEFLKENSKDDKFWRGYKLALDCALQIFKKVFKGEK